MINAFTWVVDAVVPNHHLASRPPLQHHGAISVYSEYILETLYFTNLYYYYYG